MTEPETIIYEINPKFIITDFYESLVLEVDIYVAEQLSKLKDEDEKDNDEGPSRKKAKLDDEDDSKNDDETKIDDPENYPNGGYEGIEAEDVFLEDTDTFYGRYYRAKDYNFNLGKSKQEPRSTSVREFLNQMRVEMISEINKGRDKSLAHYETIKHELPPSAPKDFFERFIKPKLFAKNDMLIFIDTQNCGVKVNVMSPFQMYLFVFDFYVSAFQRHLLK